jgi:adenosylmethionine-8-amino-7-oxononanoate aminotransferase
MVEPRFEDPGSPTMQRGSRNPREWPFLATGDIPEVVRAEGVHFHLRDGRRVLDAAGGGGAVNVGYGRAEVVSAMARAAGERSYVVPGFATVERAELVRYLREEWLPSGIGAVHLVNSGSEATEAAVILAVRAQSALGREGRWRVVGRDLGYHGATLQALALGGHAARTAGLGKLLPEFPRSPACYCLRCPLDKRFPDCGVECARRLETVIHELGPETVAAFVAEPVVGASGGALVPPEEYWPIVREVCDRHGILLIVDEVMTGFGRLGTRFGFERVGVKPDLVVIGKGLSGGYASLAGVVVRDSIAEALASAGVKTATHTCAAHPSACAASLEVLQILDREKLVSRVAQLGERLGEELCEHLGIHPNVAEIRGCGLLWAVEVVRDRETLTPFPRAMDVARKIVRAGLDHGVFFYPGGTGEVRDVVLLCPPFTVTLAQIQLAVRVLERAIDWVSARTAG